MKISASRINAYIDCGKKYDLRYNKGIRKDFNKLTMWLGHVAEAMVVLHLSSETSKHDLETLWKMAVFTCVNDKIKDKPDDFVQLLCDWVNLVFSGEDKELIQEATVALNKEALNLNKYGFVYKPNVKNFSSPTSKGLLTNSLLEVYDTVSAFLEARETQDFFSSVEHIEFQTHLKTVIPKWGSVENVEFEGYSDIIFMTNDDRIVCMDIKYSSRSYEGYNINRDTQLFGYAHTLKKMYPDKEIQVGFITPRNKPYYHLCDMEELVSPVTASRIGQAIKGIDIGLFIPCCGGGAYKDLNVLCEFKETCEFGSKEVVKK